ncbi:phosphotransferase family protein [Cohnella terricola]|uniref:Phosphotransferase n=1 Tax=Cohnella terricola TaxID=1289167 RepID=A0A559J910_9BACL|nr:aminoglycoside phosphotransferase family protein [Cohnella terricola]TVX96326.1 phosphotransferase [Cohnella terricola]
MNTKPIIATGRTAEIIEYDNEHVLKLFRPDLPEHLVEMEFNNSKAVYETGVHCPEPIEMREYGGRKGILYTRISGSTMLQTLFQNPSVLTEEARKFAAIHIDIHKRSVEKVPAQKERLEEQIKHAPLMTAQEKDQVAERLRKLRNGDQLCHGDFHPDNIIHGESTDWVIDWMTATRGNPAGDVARTYLMLKFGQVAEEMPQDVQAMVAQVRNRILEIYLEEYLNQSSVTMDDIRDWTLPLAAARLGEWIPKEEKKQLLEWIRSHL